MLGNYRLGQVNMLVLTGFYLLPHFFSPVGLLLNFDLLLGFLLVLQLLLLILLLIKNVLSSFLPLRPFFYFLFFGLALLLVVGGEYFAVHLVVIIEDVADDFAVGDVEVPLFDADCPYETLDAVLIVALFLLDLAVGSFEMGQPVRDPFEFSGSAKDVDACGGADFESDPGNVFPVHRPQVYSFFIQRPN